ncbi:hypothetical protein [Corynebacterium sp. sy039]|nr:hypothetical protein [Corynebacterium sp. sy039]
MRYLSIIAGLSTVIYGIVKGINPSLTATLALAVGINAGIVLQSEAAK